MKILSVDNPFSDLPVYLFEEVSSTMDIARSMAEGSDAHGLVVCARHQRAGRGRIAERTWVDEPGSSLMATVVLKQDRLSFPASLLPLRVGIGIARFIESISELSVRIKWPNDILIDDRKICGILCEQSSGYLFAGFGLNCRQGSFPEELSGSGSATPPTSLLLEGHTVSDPFELIEGLLCRLRESFDDSGWDRYLNEHLLHRGVPVSFLPGLSYEQQEDACWVSGILKGVDGSGGVMIEERGTVHTWYSGELRRGRYE